MATNNLRTAPPLGRGGDALLGCASIFFVLASREDQSNHTDRLDPSVRRVRLVSVSVLELLEHKSPGNDLKEREEVGVLASREEAQHPGGKTS